MSHAVMAQRKEPGDSLDNFPTPPWATRALLEQIISGYRLSEESCLEPACGAGHMAKVQNEYFRSVKASDIYPYGYGSVRDFLTENTPEPVDWVITNPPFKLAEKFILKGLEVASVGVAMLTRTVFLESIGRYERLFEKTPPTIVAQFCERVPMVKGRLDAKASTATGYAWVVWEKPQASVTKLKWITPCRKSLERKDDYNEEVSSSTKPVPPKLGKFGQPELI